MVENVHAIVNSLYETFEGLVDFPAVKRISTAYPDLSPRAMIEQMSRSFYEEGRRLIFHVSSLVRQLEGVARGRGVSENDFVLALIAILYHDAGKIMERLAIDDVELKLIFDDDRFGHSLAVRRFFLYLDIPELAQAVRHHSTDFAIDIRRRRVTIPQLLLNIVDRLDNSGIPVDPGQKMRIVKEKIGGNPGFDWNSEAIACDIVCEMLHFSGRFAEIGFICENSFPLRSVLFTQRFDGKYCAPVGRYKHTSSNIAIAEYLSRWGWKITLLHEGNFGEVYYDSGAIHLVGIVSAEDDCMVYTAIADQVSRHETIVVEGWTTALSYLRAIVSNEKSLILLLRTMSKGSMEEDRIEKMLRSDEIWVMTDEMRKIVNAQISEAVPVRILQSGVDKRIYFPNMSVARKRGKLVYVGAVTALKGVDVLIDAFKQVKSIVSEAELHIVGTPDMYGKANKFDVKDFGSCEGVHYWGMLEPLEIAQHLQTAHIAVLLTKIYETWGKSAMQARCCGTRLLVSNSGALPFHVQSEEEGIVLSLVTKETVTDAILRLLESEPRSVICPRDRYHSWRATAVDFVTYLDMLDREKQRVLGIAR